MTAPFIAILILLLQGFAYWNKGLSASLRVIAKWTRRSLGLRFLILFGLFVPFWEVVSMFSFKLQIPKT
ncbi:hypothetical protein H5410_036932 [Solanum commersonii]|uniref:Uncharacterized protein n=1 Tax=Solanum commersonii TaxID=4109 RepID=A0A9J5Y8U2_SOLCO|nr:hypothetical protein H5410_036932 [Solanum commersonii]